MPQAVSHEEVRALNWVQVGASLWLLRPRAGESQPVREQDRVGSGEILAFAATGIAMRLWVRLPEATLTEGRSLRVSIQSSGPVLVGEVAPIDLPTVGSTFWVAAPVAWVVWERRRAFRVVVSTFCQIWLPDSAGKADEPLVRRVVNMSTMGMLIEGVPAQVGDEVRLMLELAPVSLPIALTGRVVRQESAAAGAYTAVEFHPGEAAQGVLLEYLLAVSARDLGSALHDSANVPDVWASRGLSAPSLRSSDTGRPRQHT